MKKIIATSVCFIACIFYINAQTLYGTTPLGGNGGGGTINKFIPATNNLTVLKSFDRLASYPYNNSFIQAPNGKLYSATFSGGTYGNGVIFSFDPSSSTFTMLKQLSRSDGINSYEGLILANDGKLYGTAFGGGAHGAGVIFSFDPSSATYTKLKDFDSANGAYPMGSLVQASDGKLYGTTSQGGSNGVGVIFSFNPSSSTLTNLQDFDTTNGAYPKGSLVQATDGKLYGTTSQGGSSAGAEFLGYGVIFSFDLSTSTYTKLKDLDFGTGGYPVGSLIQASNGKLYGLTTEGGDRTLGTLFSLDPLSSVFTKLKDLFRLTHGVANGGLREANDGKLYGMTGDQDVGGGDIFSFDPSSSNFATVRLFDNANGDYPSGRLMQGNNGQFYGMTNSGGSSNTGVIFSLDPSSFSYKKVFDFGTNETGSSIYGRLIQASDGKLYGMTSIGGGSGHGVIFSFNPFNLSYKKLHDFDYANGGHPFGSLTEGIDGKLYGMTHEGGKSNLGVIFSIDPQSSIFTKLKDFDGENGGHPFGSLLKASNGKMYGITNEGGNGGGVIFAFDPLTSTYVNIKVFDGITEGYNAYGSFIQATDGKLYGLTENGGGYGLGAIFSFDPVSSMSKKVMDFNGVNGSQPYGNLLQAPNGKLYGMTSAGGNRDSGVLFSFDLSSSTYTKLKDFGGTDGANPFGSLIEASDGKLYGMTNRGGSNDQGTVFSFDPSSSTFVKLNDYNGINGSYPSFGSSFIEIKDNQNKPPTVSIITPANNTTYLAPAAHIKLSAAAADKDGTITKVEFYNGTALLHTETLAPYGFVWRNVGLGNCTLTAKAYDNSGLVTTSTPVHISVVPNKPPTVNIVTPRNNQAFATPGYIHFAADATDIDGRITRVEFYNGSTLLRTEFKTPYTYVWKNVPRGRYSITAVATDNWGARTTSAPVTVKVVLPPATIVSSKPLPGKPTLDIEGFASLRLHPNPARNTVNVVIEGLQPFKQAQLSVLSASGIILKTMQITSAKTIQLDVSSLVKGVYIIKVVTGDKVLYKQFVKL